ncbi:MAG TPA: T9SS type A sorting domain-containing protein, partial [Bacteroidia bacterium]|nr:T9SS type A sorting domain-containing protein [Bacteroidia bacterium]
TNAGVNSNGSTYHFAAFETGADLVVGSYTGDGGFSKSISGLGFTPAFLIVFSNGSPSRPVWTNTQMEAIGFPGPAVAEFGVAQIWTGYVTSFDPTGFTVASFLDVSGTVYHYAAFKAVAGTLTTGSYAGTAGAKSPATGMAPQYVIACNGSVNGLSVQRLASNAVNESMDFTATASMTTEITAFNAGSYTAAAGSLQANNTGTTNYFVAIGAGQANPLPVELISFRAECDKPNNQLTWITASETNNDFFTIERTGDGEHYIPIGRIPGSGNSSSSHTYSLIDSFVPEGKLDYRLRQTDYNGEYRFPGVVESDDCNNPESEFSFRMYTGDDHQLNILFNLRADASYEFGLIDINGRSIRTGQLIASKGTNLFELNVEGYPAGLYLFRLTGSQNTITRKFYISR